MSDQYEFGSASSTSRPVPLLDLNRENGPLRAQMEAAAARVLESGRFVLGPECEQLEELIAQLCGTRYAVGCASGSDALLLALMARKVGPGDEVIVPSFTFFATASAVWRLGATPVFVDIESDTFNLDPQHVEAAITPRTRAVIPVHLFGQCAEMSEIRTLGARHQIFIIEDAAQAIGASYGGVPAGGLGDVGCFSFYPTKNLGGCGDGGILTTSSDELADRLRLLRGHGMQPRYYHEEVGVNSRLDTLQAAMLCTKLPYLSRWTKQRQENARRYHELFAETGLEREIQLPETRSDLVHVWNQYTIRVPNQRRDALRSYLSQASIGTEIYYPVPLHCQSCFAALAYGEGSLPVTERAAEEVLSLPIFPELTVEEQQIVVDCIAEFYRQSRARVAPAVAVPASTAK